MFLGLRTIIYPATDLQASKEWFTSILGIQPYFDEHFYVGFTVGGYELGLDPDADPEAGPLTYWGVADIELALNHLLEAGASRHQDIEDVGNGIRVAAILEPGGAKFGIIENPHFTTPLGADEEEPGH